MIVGIYATLGVFLFLAAKNPLEHLSLIWFTVWSSVVHGGIMGVQALVSPEHRAPSREKARAMQRAAQSTVRESPFRPLSPAR
jgi:hypothetical protein